MDRNIEAYNKIAKSFDEGRSLTLMEKSYLELFLQYIPDHGSVLDLGCGTGRPILQFLRNYRLQIMACDASEKMLDLAKKHFPDQEFILQDMRNINFEKEYFDGIIAWHSLFHLTKEDQQKVIKNLATQLKVGGILLFTSGNANEERLGNNYGERLFHASFAPSEYRSILLACGFRILLHSIEDPHCGFATIWVALKDAHKA